mmetsp:Transcript_1412/g.3779  ORF Transcript_1412/g.3779 Transcript_1412/m.3779 type:complete len:217 (-) Transcript_1412:673-1323(-)
METENLHRGLGVGIESWLEAQVCDTLSSKELLQHADEVAQTQTSICNETFNLMKLSKMSGVECFVAEYAIDGETFPGHEDASFFVVFRKEFQHPRGDGRGVRSKNGLARLVLAPGVVPARGPVPSVLVHFLNTLQVISGNVLRSCRRLYEESVMRIARWVLLRLEEGIEVPEGTFDPPVCRHLLEAHQQQYLSDFLLHFHQRVQVPTLARDTAHIR